MYNCINFSRKVSGANYADHPGILYSECHPDLLAHTILRSSFVMVQRSENAKSFEAESKNICNK